MVFHNEAIEGMVWIPLRKYSDQRGWVVELFRNDELPCVYWPVMAYISQTEPGVARGPHEHVDQSDYFCFYGPSNFRLYLWDNRPYSRTYCAFESKVLGINHPMAVVIPPGVVHAYQNVGGVPGLVFNSPNQLYRGVAKKEQVDEIRHEDDPNSPFKLMDLDGAISRAA